MHPSKRYSATTQEVALLKHNESIVKTCADGCEHILVQCPNCHKPEWLLVVQDGVALGECNLVAQFTASGATAKSEPTDDPPLLVIVR